jgi:hypothetical protein
VFTALVFAGLRGDRWTERVHIAIDRMEMRNKAEK